VPDAVLLAWPEFYLDETWISASELAGSVLAGADSALGRTRRTLAADTPTALAIVRKEAPARRRAAMSATRSSVNLEGPLGPRFPGARAATPASPAMPCQRRRVSVLTPNPSAT
jgi:hypothetical protein